jgi:hypothetical protein
MLSPEPAHGFSFGMRLSVAVIVVRVIEAIAP